MDTKPNNQKEMHYVISKDDLAEGERAIIEIKGREIAVFNTGSEYHAIGDHCPHMGGLCAEGLLSGLFLGEMENYDIQKKTK